MGVFSEKFWQVPGKSEWIKLISLQGIEKGHKESWALKNWCFWTVVLEKILGSLLDCKEIKLVNPKGNQSWISYGRTDAKAEAPILWPPNVKTQLVGKDPDAGKDWGREGGNREWDDWMALATQWMWVWAYFGRLWGTVKGRSPVFPNTL